MAPSFKTSHICPCAGHNDRLLIENLSNDNGDGNENVTWKHNFIFFVLLCDYFNSSNLYKNGELPNNQIGRS